MKYWYSTETTTACNKSGRDVIRALEKGGLITVYWENPLYKHEIVPIISRELDGTLTVRNTYAFCTKEMVAYLKKQKALEKENI